MNDDLSHLRERIDELDVEIVNKIQERASIASKIGEVKRSKGEEIFRPDREINASIKPLLYSLVF